MSSAQDTRASGQLPQLTFATFPSQGMGVLFKRILTEAYSRIGYEIKVVHVAADQALRLSDGGEVDGEAARVPVIEAHHHNLIRVPTPLYTNRVVLYAKRGRVVPAEGWLGLMQLKIGVVKGYKFIEAQTSAMNRVIAESYEQVFTLLDEGKVDAVMVEYLDSMSTYLKVKPRNTDLVNPPWHTTPCTII